MSYEIIEKLKKEIEGFKDVADLKPIGHVIEIGDGVLKINGLRNAMSQEMLVVQTANGQVTALALNLEEDALGAIALGDYAHIKVGDEVSSTGKVLSINVGRELIGRVVNPLGEPVDGKG